MTVHDTGRQGIVTRYLPATNTKPSRIVARADAGYEFVNYDHELTDIANHAAAAQAFANRFGWPGDWVQAGSPGQDGYLFCPLPL